MNAEEAHKLTKQRIVDSYDNEYVQKLFDKFVRIEILKAIDDGKYSTYLHKNSLDKFINSNSEISDATNINNDKLIIGLIKLLSNLNYKLKINTSFSTLMKPETVSLYNIKSLSILEINW